MRRIPGLGCVVVAQALAIVMTDDRRALAALGPVAARPVLAGRERGAVRLRAGQDVVHVGRVAAAVDRGALLGQRGLLADAVLAVELGDVLGDHLALGILPRALSDPIARIDGVGSQRSCNALVSLAMF